MKKYKRICIIGNSGSGKTYLSKILTKRTGLPLYHIDKIYWLPGWVRVPVEECRAKVVEMSEADEWIFEGNNKSTFRERFDRTELVVFLDVTPVLCCFRALKRMMLDKVRDDMAEGCEERFDWKFCRYMLTYRKKIRPVVEALIEEYKDKVDFCVVKNKKERDKFIEELTEAYK
ncbi:MAG: hypothetical protein LBL47_00530 [Lactobacillus sp.]|nr:hypothetical protein [Lactobacillus sp.]